MTRDASHLTPEERAEIRRSQQDRLERQMSRSEELQKKIDSLDEKVGELKGLVEAGQKVLSQQKLLTEPVSLQVGDTVATIETGNDLLELIRAVMKLCDAMPSERVELKLSGETLTVGPADLDMLSDQLKVA